MIRYPNQTRYSISIQINEMVGTFFFNSVELLYVLFCRIVLTFHCSQLNAVENSIILKDKSFYFRNDMFTFWKIQ